MSSPQAIVHRPGGDPVSALEAHKAPNINAETAKKARPHLMTSSHLPFLDFAILSHLGMKVEVHARGPGRVHSRDLHIGVDAYPLESLRAPRIPCPTYQATGLSGWLAGYLAGWLAGWRNNHALFPSLGFPQWLVWTYPTLIAP